MGELTWTWSRTIKAFFVLGESELLLILFFSGMEKNTFPKSMTSFHRPKNI